MDSPHRKIKEFLKPFVRKLAPVPCWIEQINNEAESEYVWRHPGRQPPTSNEVVETNGACLVVPRPNTPVYPRTITNADHAATVRARLTVVIARARCWLSKVPSNQYYNYPEWWNIYDLKPDVQRELRLYVTGRERLILHELYEGALRRPIKQEFFNGTLRIRLELMEAKQNLRCNRYGTDVAEDMFIGVDTPIETRQLEVDRIRANLRGDAHGTYMCDDDVLFTQSNTLSDDLEDLLEMERRAVRGISTPIPYPEQPLEHSPPAASPIRAAHPEASGSSARAPKAEEEQLSGGESQASGPSVPNNLAEDIAEIFEMEQRALEGLSSPMPDPEQGSIANSEEGMTTSDEGPGEPPAESVAKPPSRAKSSKRKRSAAEIAEDEPRRRSARVADKTHKAEG